MGFAFALLSSSFLSRIGKLRVKTMVVTKIMKLPSFTKGCRSGICLSDPWDHLMSFYYLLKSSVLWSWMFLSFTEKFPLGRYLAWGKFPLFLYLSSLLALSWVVAHQLALDLVVFVSPFLGTGGTEAMTKLFWC